MSLIKYRVHEVAKDFNVNSKVIAEILAKYATKPATHQKVLEDNELAIIFDYMTLHNQVDSIESIFADVYHEPKPAPAPRAEEKPAAAAAKRESAVKEESGAEVSAPAAKPSLWERAKTAVIAAICGLFGGVIGGAIIYLILAV